MTPLDPTIRTYELCDCRCGCEPDGDWHFDGSAGCMCLRTGCACVTDSPGVPSTYSP